MTNVVSLRDSSVESKPLVSSAGHTFRFPFVFDGQEMNGERVSWVVKDLLISGGMSVIYGPPASGKSFCAIHIAYSVGHGIEFFSHKTSKGLVIYLCGEGAIGFRQRMRAWKLANNAAPTANFIMMPAEMDMYSDSDAVADLTGDMLAIAAEVNEPIAMIVVDTLSCYIGTGNENEAVDMNRFVANLKRMQGAIERAAGQKPHILIVHHCGKDAARGMRGSNVLLGAVDATIEVTCDEDTGVRTVKVPKIKDGAKPAPFHFRLKSVHIGQDDDGAPIYSCATEPATIDMSDLPAEQTKPKRGRKPKAESGAVVEVPF